MAYESYSLLHGLELKVPYDTLELVFHNSRLVDQDNIEVPHKHDCFEIYMVIEGAVDMMVDGQTFNLTEDNICWIGPGVEHKVVSGTTDYLYVFFSFDFVPNSIQVSTDIAEKEMKMLLQYANKYRFWVGKDIKNCRHLFEYICAELDNCEFGCYIQLCNLISSFVVSTIRNMKLNPLNYHNMFTSASIKNRYNQLMGYLREHYCEDITLQTTADFLNISTRHINRILNEHFGATFNKMLSNMRISKAKTYFTTTNYSIEKIAELVGFSSERILCKQFKEIEGMTVSQFRQLNKNKPAAAKHSGK
jgi:AraC-like DNA-binding protein